MTLDHQKRANYIAIYNNVWPLWPKKLSNSCTTWSSLIWIIGCWWASMRLDAKIEILVGAILLHYDYRMIPHPQILINIQSWPFQGQHIGGAFNAYMPCHHMEYVRTHFWCILLSLHAFQEHFLQLAQYWFNATFFSENSMTMVHDTYLHVKKGWD
jgi:hypothetical protein